MPPSSDDFYAGEEENPLKSDLFKTHMKKTELDDGTIKIKCNYCPKTYKTSKNFGYGTYWAHIRKKHSSEMVKASNQAQISRLIRDSINYIWKHNKIQKQWLTFCSQNSRRPIKFSRDISTRWNSAYKLLSESVEYKELLVSFITYNVPSSSLQLKHWDDHKKVFPILAIIAKQILGTPVSTVAVEQEFSAGGIILEPRRSVLYPQSLEAQACVDDWTKAKFRQQELEPEIVNDFFEDGQTTGTEGSE
ncbi:hypothetical protein Dsin_009950 [Dipteronia sinensis]|uniref:HAT C-terminal dimerisation domain-containing protein n=1 Tax=Dipteronia sinensis TaxID=43782 RepID=A0AAE0EDY5_9ROSI|nr:hypothetical protein Dsin_009950 [Dipteronia sinensis]